MSKQKIIHLENVWKTYKMGSEQIHALRGINLDVFEGDFVAVQGPSGSGKSTAMNCIGCLDMPSKGTIYLDGNDISKLSESKLAQIRGRKIGFIFQKFNLIPTLTALENVMLPALFQETNKDYMKEEAKHLLDIVNLSHRINHKPAQLSGGEKQRVAIARALINNPEVILADEPTGNLDSKTGEIIMKILKDLNEKHNRTIVMVTHEKDIAAHAQRTVFIKDGRVGK